MFQEIGNLLNNKLNEESTEFSINNTAKSYLLGAVLLLLGLGADLPWLNGNLKIIIIIRGAMVLGSVAAALLVIRYPKIEFTEGLTFLSVLFVVSGMALIGNIEKTYMTGYISGIYQIITFVAIFLPIRTGVFFILTVVVGILWFLIFPLLLSPYIESKLAFSHIVGYCTYSFMALAGNRLFLRVYKEHMQQLSFIKRHNEYLEEVAIQDGLTGVFNFRHFEDVLPRLIDKAKAKAENLALCIIDLDDFKLINDKYGHDVGNGVLKHVGESLKEVVRRGDFPFRLGGDEFAIVLSDASALEAYKATERLHSIFISYKNKEAGFESGLLKCSIGIAELSQGFYMPKELIKAADEAMYKAKSNGGNRAIIATNDSETVIR